ncbi:NAD(P)H-quinone oxidoreductase [Alteromonas sp. NFXS44]|uniref:NAD(P)H-quinone oxidoreductase n=1 Tax=Alteromonas sp. NFXS44 TaxID=2818435 RepID=UPI0032DEDEA6
MRYIDFDKGAGPESLKISETDTPAIASGQVLVKVHAFGVNRADTLQRQGKYPPPPGESDILGLEVSAVVTDVADDVTQWRTGDKVCGLVAGGGYAEYVAVNARHLMPVPQSMSLTHAAGLTEVFLTAWQALFTIGNLQPQDKALIHAGASGVGLAALQLCKLKGIATVTTASSEDKLSQCSDMGANLTINYKEQDFAAVLKDTWPEGVNFVLDFVAGDYLNRNLKVLAQDGHIVYLAMLAGRFADKLDMALMLGKRARIQGSTLRNRSDAYKADLIRDFCEHGLPGFDDGTLTVNVDTVLPVEDVATAHARLEANDSRGKIIVEW